MALARIGETKEQCNARYGKPLFEMQGGSVVNYKKNDVNIWVTFWNGVAHSITFHGAGAASDDIMKRNGHNWKIRAAQSDLAIYTGEHVELGKLTAECIGDRYKIITEAYENRPRHIDTSAADGF